MVHPAMSMFSNKRKASDAPENSSPRRASPYEQSLSLDKDDTFQSPPSTANGHTPPPSAFLSAAPRSQHRSLSIASLLNREETSPPPHQTSPHRSSAYAYHGGGSSAHQSPRQTPYQSPQLHHPQIPHFERRPKEPLVKKEFVPFDSAVTRSLSPSKTPVSEDRATPPQEPGATLASPVTAPTPPTVAASASSSVATLIAPATTRIPLSPSPTVVEIEKSLVEVEEPQVETDHETVTPQIDKAGADRRIAVTPAPSEQVNTNPEAVTAECEHVETEAQPETVNPPNPQVETEPKTISPRSDQARTTPKTVTVPTEQAEMADSNQNSAPPGTSSPQRRKTLPHRQSVRSVYLASIAQKMKDEELKAAAAATEGGNNEVPEKTADEPASVSRKPVPKPSQSTMIKKPDSSKRAAYGKLVGIAHMPRSAPKDRSTSVDPVVNNTKTTSKRNAKYRAEASLPPLGMFSPPLPSKSTSPVALSSAAERPPAAKQKKLNVGTLPMATVSTSDFEFNDDSDSDVPLTRARRKKPKIPLAPEAPMATTEQTAEKDALPMEDAHMDEEPVERKIAEEERWHPSPISPKKSPPFIILNHRKTPNAFWEFELLVRYNGSTKGVWEEEFAMFKKNQSAVCRYWDSLDGGREEVCEGFWKVFIVDDERVEKGVRQYRVGWVGSLHRGWEPVDKVIDEAAHVVKKWEEDMDLVERLSKDEPRTRRSSRVVKEKEHGENLQEYGEASGKQKRAERGDRLKARNAARGMPKRQTRRS